MRLSPFIAFWVLLAAGLWFDELDFKAVLIFIGFWLVGALGFPLIGLQPAWSIVYVLVLDVVLVFRIFHGDVRIR